MSGQSRRWSWVETISSTAIGYSINLLAQFVLYPLFGFNATLAQNLSLGAIFTVISIVRGYLVRRGFNRLHTYLEKE